MNDGMEPGEHATLVVRKTIDATPERLFSAWTDPTQLLAWWGPDGVTCTGADMDLRVGGRYRIGNQLPDGTVLWISGTFEVVDRPRQLTYSWVLEGSSGAAERVTVRFEAVPAGADVVVTHERIPNRALRDQHEHGWRGCLSGLAEYIGALD